MHIVFKYEACQGRRRTLGSAFLRTLMVKWQAKGKSPTCASSDEHASNRLVRLIKTRRMTKKDADSIFQEVDSKSPYYDIDDFAVHLAALSRLFHLEVTRKVGQVNLLESIVDLVEEKARYLIYYSEYVHSLSAKEHEHVAIGTTSNENLHMELNRHFDQIHVMYRPTLLIKLRIFHLSKLISHHSARFRATTRQITQQFVLRIVLSKFSLWTAEEWKEWCRALKTQRNYVEIAHMPLSQLALSQAKRLKAWKMKKPAAAKRRLPALRKKRTVFSLSKDLGSLRKHRRYSR